MNVTWSENALKMIRLLILLLALFAMLGFRPVQAEPIKLLVFGDSLAHGYGLSPDDTFPAQLERRLRDEGWDLRVINGGNSGDTTAAGLARLDWSLADEPDAILVELGANDALRGIDPTETRANLDAILVRLGDRGLPTLLAGMRAPRNLGSSYAESFDRIFPDLAEAHRVALYPFFLEGVALQPTLNQADGIHPNRDGVSVIVERILPHVIELLDRARSG